MLSTDTKVLGFTAAFGSGSTTAGKHLRDSRDFRLVTLSDAIRTEWSQRNSGNDPTRFDLQQLGDTLRVEDGPGALVERTVHALDQDPETIERVVIDSIRNLGEVRHLRATFGDRFTLIAVLCDQESRWTRISTDQYLEKGHSRTDFLADDQRDQNEEIKTGQQVQLCIDEADVVIDNAGYVLLAEFREKVGEFADLIVAENQRSPTFDEVLMHLAYSTSYQTRCLKRHVGAVVVDPVGQVVGVGYNENPIGTHPCREEPLYENRCYRDIVRDKHFKMLADVGMTCPLCGEPIGVIEGPPWRCRTCEGRGTKTNLESFFFPDRAMNWCTAVHAEVWALSAADQRARGGSLYSTTFPCMQCCERLTQAGIRRVVYTEAYVDTAGLQRLAIANIELEQFEGIRSGAFDRLFAHTRPE